LIQDFDAYIIRRSSQFDAIRIIYKEIIFIGSLERNCLSPHIKNETTTTLAVQRLERLFNREKRSNDSIATLSSFRRRTVI